MISPLKDSIISFMQVFMVAIKWKTYIKFPFSKMDLQLLHLQNIYESYLPTVQLPSGIGTARQ